MASTASPYGLRPVKKLGGQPWNNGMTTYQIDSGYGTDIFCGDVVKLVAGGTIEKATNTNDAPANGLLGVFMGCWYTDASMGTVHKNWYDASAVSVQAYALVVDDPDVVFAVQADGSVALTETGANAIFIQGSGSETTGMSGVKIDADGTNTTATFPLKIVEVPVPGEAYTDVHVRINIHNHRDTDGI